MSRVSLNSRLGAMSRVSLNSRLGAMSRVPLNRRLLTDVKSITQQQARGNVTLIIDRSQEYHSAAG